MRNNATTTTTTWDHRQVPGGGPREKPRLYQVPELRNLNLEKNLQTDRRTEGPILLLPGFFSSISALVMEMLVCL